MAITHPDIAGNIATFMGNSTALNLTSSSLFFMPKAEKASRGLFDDSMKFDAAIIEKYPYALAYFTYETTSDDHCLRVAIASIRNLDKFVSFIFDSVPIMSRNVLSVNAIISGLLQTGRLREMKDRSMANAIRAYSGTSYSYDTDMYTILIRAEMYWMKHGDGYFIAKTKTYLPVMDIANHRCDRDIIHFMNLIRMSEDDNRYHALTRVLECEKEPRDYMRGVRQFVKWYVFIPHDLICPPGLTSDELAELSGYYGNIEDYLNDVDMGGCDDNM